MFFACFLLIIAIIGGTLLTFLFDRTAPRGARLCMGAAIGLALMATVGFLLALVLGLGAASIIFTSVILLLPLLLLAKRERRAVILYLLGPRPSAARGSNAQGIGNLTFAGVRFAYPFLVDFLAAMLVRAGAGVIFAMWLQNMVLALAFVGLLHYWTILLTRNRLAGVIAPLLVLFNGGLGWWLLFSDSSGSDGFLSTLASLQHDYTIVPNSILRWGNSLTTLFVPQRSILFGMPLAITIFCQWWLAISRQEDAPPANEPTATSALEQ